MDHTADASPLLSFLLTHEEAFKSRARLSSLYSDFHAQQATNPDGFHANISAWRKALGDAAKAGLLPGGDALVVQTGEALLRDLEMRGWGRPSCLGLVLNDALAKGEMVPLSDFMDQRHSIYTKPGWMPSPWRILPWALRQLGILGPEGGGNDRLAVGDFVVKANVESAASAVLSMLSKSGATSGPSLIYSKDSFNTAFSRSFSVNNPLTDRDTSILLTHLSRDRNACSYDADSGVVKFVSSTQKMASERPPPITENDISIARLKTLIQALESDVPALDSRVSALDKNARQAVAAGKTANARAALRSKKLASGTLEKRRDTLFQLQEVYTRIETAADNIEIVKVMEASAGVLRNLNREVGGVERAEEVIDRLHDEMQQAEDINQVLADSAKAAIDEEEVDEEFEALERAEREKKEKAERDERERKEKVEAEQTRKRLEELDGLERERRRKEDEAASSRNEEGETHGAADLPAREENAAAVS